MNTLNRPGPVRRGQGRALPAVSIHHLGPHRDGLPHLLNLVEQGVQVNATGFGRVDLDAAEVVSAIVKTNPSALMVGTDFLGSLTGPESDRGARRHQRSGALSGLQVELRVFQQRPAVAAEAGDGPGLRRDRQMAEDDEDGRRGHRGGRPRAPLAQEGTDGWLRLRLPPLRHDIPAGERVAHRLAWIRRNPGCAPWPTVPSDTACYDTSRRMSKSTRRAPRAAATICQVLCREGRTSTWGAVTVGKT